MIRIDRRKLKTSAAVLREIVCRLRPSRILERTRRVRRRAKLKGPANMRLETHTIGHGASSTSIVPARGALVSELRVDEKDILYLDRSTLEDPTTNVRGGIPVLFPYAGRLDGNVFVAAGTEMKQHGFGRNKAWSVRERHEAMIRLALEPDAQTRAQFPFEFFAEQALYALTRGLHLELIVENGSSQPLPVSPGWHPYFRCPGILKKNVSGDVAHFPTEKLGNDEEFDFGLPAPKNGRATFTIPELGELRLSFAPEMRHLQFWSQPGKDFICIEPFWGPNNTINTDRRALIEPGKRRTFWMRIEIDA